MRKAISPKDIKDARQNISRVVSESVVETFTTMFGQEIAADALGGKFVSGKGDVFSSIKLHQGDVHVEFCFRFDIGLLLRAAERIFSKEYLASNPVHEDIACEIANIVCSKVKAFLNDSGFDTEIGFPFVPGANESTLLKNQDMVHMHFYFGEQDKKGVGVVANFFPEPKE